jgi:hypothetical protein
MTKGHTASRFCLLRHKLKVCRGVKIIADNQQQQQVAMRTTTGDKTELQQHDQHCEELRL